MAEIKLTPQLHPDMKMPVRIDHLKMFFKVPASKAIGDLVDDVEDFFERSFGASGCAVKLCGTMVWNSKDLSKSLPREAKVSDHFLDGEVFFIYGDIVQKHQSQIPEKDKTPVIIFRGFHDSGQSVLVDDMLSEQRERKITMIENEFGDVSINDLQKCLNSILDEMEMGESIDVIAVEITSMADVLPIIQTCASRPRFIERLRFDGVIAVAGHRDDKIEEWNTNKARQQFLDEGVCA